MYATPLPQRLSTPILLGLLCTTGCGASRLFLPTANIGGLPALEDRPCVLAGTDDWERGELLQHKCGAWTADERAYILAQEYTWFPHFLIGATSSTGRKCEGCSIEVRRNGSREGTSITFYVPPNDTVMARYEGSLRDGMFDGPGSLSMRRTDACRGYCTELFVANGEPVTTMALSGTWRQGFLDTTEPTLATFTYDHGGTYLGEVRHDDVLGPVPHGQGESLDSDKLRYVGAFADGLPHGQGTATFPDGRTYKGFWDAGAWQGRGDLTLPDGANYDGDFKNGRRHGRGIETRPGGERYDGEWEGDERHGEGSLLTASGVLIRGTFERGELADGAAQIIWPTGEQYDGEVRSGNPHGRGVLTLSTGSFHGDFAAGRMSGFGVWRGVGGHTYVGPWVKGRPEGCGLHLDPDADAWVGLWSSGVPVSATCPDWPRLLPSDLPEVPELEITRRTLSDAYAAQRRTQAGRQAAEARLPALRGRYAGSGPPPQTGAQRVHLAMSWPADRRQRFVAPLCVEDETLTVNGRSVEAAVGGLVDAFFSFDAPPGQNADACVSIDGPCGTWRGCTSVEVPVASERDPVWARVLLEESATEPPAAEPTE